MNDTAWLLLHKAYSCFRQGDYPGYNNLTGQLTALSHSWPQDSPLRGEFLLVSSLPHLLRPQLLLPFYQQALPLLKGRSRILPEKTSLLQDTFDPLTSLLRTPGRAQEAADSLEQAEALHQQVTGFQGNDAALCRAQLALFRGQLAEARTMAFHIFLKSNTGEANMTSLGAAALLCRLCAHTGDLSLWRYSFQYICRAAEEKLPARKPCAETSRLVQSQLCLTAGLFQKVPGQVKSTRYLAFSTPWGYQVAGEEVSHSVFPTLLITQAEFFSLSGRHMEALNIMDMAQKVYGIARMPVYNAYLDLYRGLCYKQMNMPERVRPVLESALAQLAPDGLWLIAAEFEPVFGAQLIDICAEFSAEGAENVRRLGSRFLDKLSSLRETLKDNSLPHLTKREKEILRLTASNLTNAEIARQLQITRNAVRFHLKNIYAKLMIDSRDQMAEIYGSQAIDPEAFPAQNI